MADLSYFRPSMNIEDRRDNPDMTPEWKNVPGSLAALATSLGNYLWGMPMIPEAPDSPMSDALGKRDIAITPNIGSRSPLDRAIDAASDEISIFLPQGRKLGTDTPFTQREFSKGYFAPQSFMPTSLSSQIVGAESGGNATATNPNSSATGAGQFINSTWLSLIRQNRPDLVQGKSDDEILAMRNDPALSKEMVDAYARDNNAILQKNGLPVTPGNTYLAHFAGPQGAVSILQADPSKSAGEILGSAVVRANPHLANMSAGDLQAWAARKMGGTQPAPASPVAPANAPPVAPMPTAPIFAPQAPQQAQQQSPEPEQPFVPSAIQPLQIQYPQRRPISLAGLRPAAPIFARGR